MTINLVGKAVRKFRLPTVDYSNAPIIVIPAQEGDVHSRCFEITLYDDLGDIDVSQYTRVVLNGETPTGTILTTDACEINATNKTVIAEFGGELTAQAGKVACEIMLTGTGKTLTSRTFYVMVAKSQASGIVTENDDNYNLLLSFINAEEARVAAENGRVTAEQSRTTQFNTLKGQMEGVIRDAAAVAQNAAAVQAIYDNMNVLIYFDAEGRPCWENK